MTEENKLSNDILAILKALTDKIESLEKTVYAKDNLLMKSGLVVSESPTPTMDNKIASPVGDVASMDWSEIHKMVEKVGGQ